MMEEVTSRSNVEYIPPLTPKAKQRTGSTTFTQITSDDAGLRVNGFADSRSDMDSLSSMHSLVLNSTTPTTTVFVAATQPERSANTPSADAPTTNGPHVVTIRINTDADKPKAPKISSVHLKSDVDFDTFKLTEPAKKSSLVRINVDETDGAKILDNEDLSKVDKPPYIYCNSYVNTISSMVMSSGQCSPSDTLDSGTCSDLDGTPPPLPKKKTSKSSSAKKAVSVTVISSTRNQSEVDFEDNDSNISCDSLNSSELNGSVHADESHSDDASKKEKKQSSEATLEALPKANNKDGSFLPQGLLQDIRDRSAKLNTVETESELQIERTEEVSPTINENALSKESTQLTSFRLVSQLNSKVKKNSAECLKSSVESMKNNTECLKSSVESMKYSSESLKSSVDSRVETYKSGSVSLPGTLNKTPLINESTYEDRKQLDKMKAEQLCYSSHYFDTDKFYDFHLNEKQFDDVPVKSVSETKSVCNDLTEMEYFAGIKDYKNEELPSTIKSSKGTIRGVKNRVRAGIATFLQIQSTTKSYKEKDAGKVVLYTTTMGVVRNTYQRCLLVKKILRNLLVKYEERDVFMSTEYQDEIRDRMRSDQILVPQLFIDGQHVGDAETVEKLNESGDLRKMLKPYKSPVNPLTKPKTPIPSAVASDSSATTRNSPKVLEINEDEVVTQVDNIITTPIPSPSPTSWLPDDGESEDIRTPSQISSVNYALPTHEVYENIATPSDISSVSQVPTPSYTTSSRIKTFKTDKGKKRLAHKERWLVVERKLKKNTGEEFVNKKGKVVESKKLKDPCTDKCRLKCTQKISHEDRKRVFEYFWVLGEKKKHWEFVIKNTKKSLKRRQTTEVTKHDRQNTYQYFLPNAEKKPVKVCKTMFLNTIALSERVVSTAWKKFDGNTVIEDDKRGHYEHRRRVYNDDMVKSVCDHVRCFPVVEAHYVRKNSSKLYLEGVESISRMYKLYCEWFDASKYSSKATTKRQYREVVNANFNLALHRPKKDKCDVCHIFENKSTSTDEEKSAFDLHQQRKNKARDLKKSDKQEAQVNKDDVVTATFDFQKVLVCPYGEISVLYYKRRFATINFTVYDVVSKIGTCYMWHEAIARRGSIEVSSCLLNFIKFHAERGVKEFRFWSDNCAGQNRNRIVFSLYMFVAKKLGVTVTHRFLEKGHTQNEGDSVHATIERYSKHKTIWVPEEWYCLVRWAKSEGDPYIVKEIRKGDIFDFKALLLNKNWTKNTKNEKVSWKSIREVKVSAEQNDRIDYKYDFDEEPQTIVVLRSGTRNKKRLENDLELKQAYQEPLPITKEKYKDLTDLCRGGIIPERYHDFYLNLPHTNASNIVITREESDPEDD